MRRLILAAALTSLAVPAMAADLSVAPLYKAPAGYPYSSSGFYWGIGASSVGTNASVTNTGVVSVGAGVDGIIGWQWKGGLDFIAIEADATYTNLGNSSACVAGQCSLGYQFEIEPRVKFGFPVNTLLALLPNLSTQFPALPSLPANFVPLSVHPYVFAGAPIRDVSANFGLASGKEWTVQGELGAGALNQMANGVAVDASVGVTVGQGAFTFGPAGAGSAKLGTGVQTRLSVLY